MGNESDKLPIRPNLLVKKNQSKKNNKIKL